MELRAKRGGPYVLLKTPILGMLKAPLSPRSLGRHSDYVAVLRETVDSAVEDETTSQDVSVIDPIVQVMAAPLPPEMGSVRRFLTKCGLAGYTLGIIENRDPVAVKVIRHRHITGR